MLRIIFFSASVFVTPNEGQQLSQVTSTGFLVVLEARFRGLEAKANKSWQLFGVS